VTGSYMQCHWKTQTTSTLKRRGMDTHYRLFTFDSVSAIVDEYVIVNPLTS
jgi:hypothetical protein